VQQATVLCVENAESGFIVSKKILQSGAYRTITVTNKETALKAFSVIRADATVFDCRFLAAEGVATAATMRDMDARVPQFLVAPAENMTDFADAAGLIYVVHDLDVLGWQLKTVLHDMRRHNRQLSRLMGESTRLQENGRELSQGMHRGLTNLQSTLQRLNPVSGGSEEKVAAPAHDFTRIELSACKRCGKIVSLTDNAEEVMRGEQEHHCAA
jgi:response regulator RpfG family c-di-GMP phosphodiesterase